MQFYDYNCTTQHTETGLYVLNLQEINAPAEPNAKPARSGSRAGSESRANEAAVFMSEHGMLPLVHMLLSSDSTRVSRKLVRAFSFR